MNSSTVVHYQYSALTLFSYDMGEGGYYAYHKMELAKWRTMLMWGYLPAASASGLHLRQPILSPAEPSTMSSQDEIREVCGGACGVALAITSSGKINMWGLTEEVLQSGHPCCAPKMDRMEPYELDLKSNVVEAAGGWAHTVAVTDDGNVSMWGWGDLSPQQVSQRMKGQEPERDEPRTLTLNDCTAILPPTSLGFGSIVKSVAAGARHTLVLLDVGDVWGWGYGEEGQLGVGHRLHLTSSPQPIKFPRLSHGVNHESGGGQGIPEVGTRVTKIACGGRHSVAMSECGSVFTFGWGLYGQCGQGHTDDQLSPVYVRSLSGIQVTTLSAGLWHTVLGTQMGDVYVTGGNQFGQLGTREDQAEMLPTLVEAPVLESETVKDVSCGARHTVALTEKGKIFSWGWNKYGQLGVGDKHQRDTPVEVPLGEHKVATSIACGWWHTLALVEGSTDQR